jgi:hypothetical protein
VAWDGINPPAAVPNLGRFSPGTVSPVPANTMPRSAGVAEEAMMSSSVSDTGETATPLTASWFEMTASCSWRAANRSSFDRSATVEVAASERLLRLLRSLLILARAGSPLSSPLLVLLPRGPQAPRMIIRAIEVANWIMVFMVSVWGWFVGMESFLTHWSEKGKAFIYVNEPRCVIISYYMFNCQVFLYLFFYDFN